MNLNNLQSTFVYYTIIVCLIILFDACCYLRNCFDFEGTMY